MTSPNLPTLSPEEAADRTWDFLVAGAGIAGSACAYPLAQSGAKVLLLDKSFFPRPKTCGGCLNPRTVAALHRLGLGQALRRLSPKPLGGISFLRPNGPPALVRFTQADPSPVAVSRNALDLALLRECHQAGVFLLLGTRALSTRVDKDLRLVEVADPSGVRHTFRARVVLGCDGLGGPIARTAGLLDQVKTNGLTASKPKIGASVLLPPTAFPSLPPDLITMCCTPSGYAGVARYEQGHWGVAGALRTDALKAAPSPEDLLIEVLASCGVDVPEQLIRHEGTVTCPVLQRRTLRPHAERLLLVGDSSGYVEPITGEGMAWAAESAEAAAVLLRDGWQPGTGRAYEAAWRRIALRRQRTVRTVARLLDSPLATASGFAILNLLPGLGDRVARRLSQPTPAPRAILQQSA